jgi:hexosaminidase
MHKSRLIAILLLSLCVSPVVAQSSLALMPVPASISTTPGRLPLDSKFGVSLSGFSDERLERAADRMLQRLGERTGLELSPRQTKTSGQTLVIKTDSAGMKIQGLEEDESYSLEINSQQAVLRSHTVVGALRGLETLQQLLDADQNGFFFPFVQISDRPRFPWRGLLIDVSRHWQPVAAIKRTLEAMSVVKLNVFHWHLTDYEGFRVESRRFPRLQERGSNGLYYTQAEVRDIVAYARDRGIRVLPEFDMPSHAHAWFPGYPKLASLPWSYTSLPDHEVDNANFDPTKEATYRFIDEFIGEMTRLFPDKYWHIGGDEVDGSSWDKNPAIQAFMKRKRLKSNAELQAYFNHRLVQILQKHGRRMVGWDEILRPDLRKDVVVQSWRGVESLGASAKLGFDGILSAPYYLDRMERSSKYYAADPLPAGNDLDATQDTHILGGEVCMWGELTSQENIDSRMWPYSAAIAERFWSPREVTDAEDMYRRLEAASHYLEGVGTQHVSNLDRMLRRVSGGEIPSALRIFSGLVEPLRLGARWDARPFSSRTPLVALGDIAVADPIAGRRFTKKVRGFLADAPQHEAFRSELVQEFRSWRDLKPAMTSLAQSAPLLHDAEATAADLSELGTAGEEAVTFLANGGKPPSEWTQRQALLMDRARTPKGLLRIAVLDAMQQLLTAANALSP